MGAEWVSLRCGIIYMCNTWRYVVSNDLLCEKEELRYLVLRYGVEYLNQVLSLL